MAFKVGARGHRYSSPALPLAWVYTLVVLYASLYPFSDWRWPPGQPLLALLALPWPPWRDPFDLWANLLGYLPWGLLTMTALNARGHRAGRSLLWLLLLALALSYGCEVAQHFLPRRHPSLKDCAMNVAGAAVGAALAVAARAAQLHRLWAAMRERSFVAQSGGGLALLALWPAALLFPAPLPLGLGQVGEGMTEALASWTEGVPWALPLHELVASAPRPPSALPPLSEGLATALGLFAPCMLAYAIALPGWHRALLTLGAALLSIAAMTLSTLLNFGPTHAWSWLTPATPPALAAGALAALALLALPQRVAAGLALVALAASVMLVSQAPANAYFAQTLQAWEQGRFVHFHGMAHWLSLLWPFMAMVWLLVRLGRRD
jgi:VanZ family protein